MDKKNKKGCKETILEAYEKRLKRRIEEKDYIPTEVDPDMEVILDMLEDNETIQN